MHLAFMKHSWKWQCSMWLGVLKQQRIHKNTTVEFTSLCFGRKAIFSSFPWSNQTVMIPVRDETLVNRYPSVRSDNIYQHHVCMMCNKKYADSHYSYSWHEWQYSKAYHTWPQIPALEPLVSCLNLHIPSCYVAFFVGHMKQFSWIRRCMVAACAGWSRGHSLW